MITPAFLVLFFQDSIALTGPEASLLIGIFGVGVVVAGALGGVMADSFGAKRLILMSQPIAMLVAAGYFLAPTMGFGVVAALAGITGLLSAIDRPAGAAIISNVVGKKDFAKAYSLYLMGFNAGMTLSPVLAGFLLQSFPPGIFIAWGVTCGCYLFLARALPEMRVTRAGKLTFAGVAQGIIAPYRRPQVSLFLILCFVTAIVYLQLNSTLPLAMRGAGLSPVEIGLLFALNAVLSIALLPLVPRLAGEWRPGRALALASILIGVGFGFNIFGTDMLTFGGAVLIWTLGEVIWAPMSATFLAERAPDGQTSSYQSSFFFSWNLALVVGGPIGIIVGETYGYSAVWGAALAIGAISALGFLLLPRVRDAQIAPVAAAE